jgi:cellulose synthase/poly-beta-1,6-N-acetylglucosamine synthase-like glycosyltransferase
MKISFVIPAHNEEARIGACLEAIQKEIARAEGAREIAPGESEIIVVNNVSTDKTKDIALSYTRVAVVDEHHKGLVWARHGGFAASSGELVANIDADVLLPAGWLAKVLSEFKNNTKLVALSGPFIYYDISLSSRAMVKIFYFFGLLLALLFQYVFRVGALLQGGNFVVRRDALVRAGGYDTTITFYGEDIDVAKRMSKIGKVKWTFGLPVYSSGRRLKSEGILRSAMRYTINNWWMTFFGKPFTHQYKDIRPE